MSAPLPNTSPSMAAALPAKAPSDVAVAALPNGRPLATEWC